MGAITRSPSIPPHSGGAAGSRLVIVRPGARSVRPQDLAAPRAPRLHLVALITLASTAGAWLAGLLGYRLGFASAMRVPDLSVDALGGASHGAMMLVAVPSCVLTAGLESPWLLMALFAAVAMPAGALVLARPRTPGGPRPRPLASGFAATGAILAMVSGVLAIAWIGSPARLELLAPLPFSAAAVAAWARSIASAAGLDVLVVAALVLWTILVARLPIPIWLRALSGAAVGFALLVCAVSLAASLGTSAHLNAARPLVQSETSRVGLLLGSTAHHIVVLEPDDDGDRIVTRLLGAGSPEAQTLWIGARDTVPGFFRRLRAGTR